jgi:adenosylcobinamide-phosphate synthase
MTALGLTPAAIAAGAVILARFGDGMFSEPPTAYHPVAWFGSLVEAVDREWPAPRFVGALATLTLPIVAGAAVGGIVFAGSLLSPLLAGVLAGGSLFVCVSLEMLLSEAATVVKLSESDLAAARERLRSLAGRDATELSAAEVRSAPLFAFTVGAAVSLPVAAGLAAWVKAVNTMDSMLGYQSKPVGWAAARLDDAVMFVPARVTAFLLAAVAGMPGTLVVARRFAVKPASPNSGWPMATLAAVLGCRLRKPDTYDLFPDGVLPDATTAGRGIATVRRAGVVGFLLAAITAGLLSGATRGMVNRAASLGGAGWL